MKKCLSHPFLYELLRCFVGARKFNKAFVSEYFKMDHMRVLDIGCGPARILEYLPPVDYVGFDMSASYINAAKKKYCDRSRFYVREIGRDSLCEFMTHDYDIVMARGVLHHLNDELTNELFELASKAMRPTAKLVTVDGCYADGQSSIARRLLNADRGKCVRTKDGYKTLASRHFPHIKTGIYHNLLYIPYTHVIMECSL